MASIQLGIQYSISSMTKFEERDLLMQVIHLKFDNGFVNIRYFKKTNELFGDNVRLNFLFRIS